MSTKIRFIKDEGPYAPGDEIEPDMPGVAALYVERGVAEYVEEKVSAFEDRQNAMAKLDKIKVKA